MAVVKQAFADFGLARDAVSVDIADPTESLLARCRAYCQFALDNPGPYRFMFSNEAPRADDGSLVGSESIEALATSIRRCQNAGVAAAMDDPVYLAAQVWSALHGLVLLRMNVEHFPWPTSLFEMVDLTVRRLLVLIAS